jgi:hypothetical protein
VLVLALPTKAIIKAVTISLLIKIISSKCVSVDDLPCKMHALHTTPVYMTSPCCVFTCVSVCASVHVRLSHTAVLVVQANMLVVLLRLAWQPNSGKVQTDLKGLLHPLQSHKLKICMFCMAPTQQMSERT